MENKIVKALQENAETGLSIAELARKLKSSRFVIRNALLRLEGANKVQFRKIVTGKFYFLKEGKKNE